MSGSQLQSVPGMADRVACIVIGRNEGERLARCLVSLRGRVRHIVYVDSGSTDGSTDLARSLGVTVVGLLDGPFTAARGRQAGVDEVVRRLPGVEYIQFIDGDCVLGPAWIDAGVRWLDANPRCAAVTGRRRESRAAESFYSRLVDIDWDIPPGPVAYFGGDSLVRAAALADAGGWRPDLIAGEEPDLCFRMADRGWRIHRLDQPMTLHDIAMRSFRPYWRRSVRSGHAYAEVGWRHRHGTGRTWLRRTAGILLYGAALPPLIALAAWLYWPIAVLLGLLYVRLVLSMTLACRRRGRGYGLSLAYATINTACKVAGAIGIARYVLGALSGRRSRIIEYKGPALGESSP